MLGAAALENRGLPPGAAAMFNGPRPLVGTGNWAVVAAAAEAAGTASVNAIAHSNRMKSGIQS
jgi:hypothetical protein